MTDTPQVDIDNSQTSEGVGKTLPLADPVRQDVDKAASNLQSEFEASKGGKIADFLSGDGLRSSDVHSFLFEKAQTQTDDNSRRNSHLAHLQLELTHNHSPDRIINAYGQQLSKGGIPRAQIYPAIFSYEGMVPTDTEIPKGHQGEKLVIEKENIADLYTNFADRYKAWYDMLEGKELKDGKSREESAAIAATQEVLLTYFGFPNEHTATRNRQMYQEQGRRNVTEFANNKTATCTEMGAIAQEFLSFAGLRSMLVSGGPLLIADSDGNYEQPDMEGHVYNLLFLGEQKDKPFLFDPSNFLIVPNQADPSLMQVQSFITPLSTEQVEDLGNHRNMEVEVGGEKRLYSMS